MPSQVGNSGVSGRLAKRVDRVLRNTRVELATAKKILAEDKRVAKRAKDKLARKNAKRAAKLMQKTILSLEDHHELLVQQQKNTRGDYEG